MHCVVVDLDVVVVVVVVELCCDETRECSVKC